MSNPIVDVIGGAIAPVLDTVLDAYKHKDEVKIKEKELQNAKEKIAGELKLKILQELHKPQSELYDFVIAYEGSGDKQPPSVQFLRSSVRPLVTYWAIGIITALMFGWIDTDQIQSNLDAIPEQMWTIFLTIFGFWFGGRALMQVAETWQKGTLDTTRAQNRNTQSAGTAPTPNNTTPTNISPTTVNSTSQTPPANNQTPNVSSNVSPNVSNSPKNQTTRNNNLSQNSNATPEELALLESDLFED